MYPLPWHLGDSKFAVDRFRARDHLSAIHHIATEFGKCFSALSAIFVTEGLFSALCVVKQKLKICPFSAIIESVLPVNLLAYLLSYMISSKKPILFFSTLLCTLLFKYTSPLSCFFPALVNFFWTFEFISPTAAICHLANISITQKSSQEKKLKVIEKRQHF